MRIQATDSTRPTARAPKPAEASRSAMAGDRYVASAAGRAPGADDRFTWGEAGRLWWRGFIAQPMTVLNNVRERPMRSLAIGLAAGAAILLVPVVLPISLAALGTGLSIAFGTWGAANMAAGGYHAWRGYRQGRFDDAERAFEQIGRGSFDLASAAAPYLGRKAIKALRPGAATAEAAYAERLSNGAEIVSAKADGLELAAKNAAAAGRPAEAAKMASAAEQIKRYERVLIEQSTALDEGAQTAEGARRAVQEATRAVHGGAARPELSPFRLANDTVQRSPLHQLAKKATHLVQSVRADQDVAYRAQAARRAMGLRRFLKIVRTLVSAVPVSTGQAK